MPRNACFLVRSVPARDVMPAKWPASPATAPRSALDARASALRACREATPPQRAAPGSGGEARSRAVRKTRARAAHASLHALNRSQESGTADAEVADAAEPPSDWRDMALNVAASLLQLSQSDSATKVADASQLATAAYPPSAHIDEAVQDTKPPHA
eukprot:5584757-Pleurochrysis_carterae.AAC.2